jgi:hypothetical protein
MTETYFAIAWLGTRQIYGTFALWDPHEALVSAVTNHPKVGDLTESAPSLL